MKTNKWAADVSHYQPKIRLEAVKYSTQPEYHMTSVIIREEDSSAILTSFSVTDDEAHNLAVMFDAIARSR